MDVYQVVKGFFPLSSYSCSLPNLVHVYGTQVNYSVVHEIGTTVLYHLKA